MAAAHLQVQRLHRCNVTGWESCPSLYVVGCSEGWERQGKGDGEGGVLSVRREGLVDHAWVCYGDDTGAELGLGHA